MPVVHLPRIMGATLDLLFCTSETDFVKPIAHIGHIVSSYNIFLLIFSLVGKLLRANLHRKILT
jgi:hypothetical protein